MAINTLYITTKTNKSFNKPLLDKNNFSQIIKSATIDDYKTTLEDLGATNLQKVFPFAKKIELVEVIDHYFTNYDNLDYEVKFGSGRLFYELYHSKDKNIISEVLDKINFKNLNSNRATKEPMLWVSGCSVTYGSGIISAETYSNLLGKKLKINTVNLAIPGASVFYAVDTLLRSDIQKGDIVVLGVTSLARYEYSEHWSLRSKSCVNPDDLAFIDLEYFDSPTHILKCGHTILQLINFCNKIGAKVIIANLLDSTWLPLVFDGHPNFINLVNTIDDIIKFIDLGDDNSHPGPLQHQDYADKLFNFVQRLND